MTTLDEVRKRDALWRADELEEQISDVFRDRRWLLARVDELAEALTMIEGGVYTDGGLLCSDGMESIARTALARLSLRKVGNDNG